jgi:hypothetical protein
MDNSTQFGVDNRSRSILCGYSGLTPGALLGLLGADKGGTQCRILVLSNPYRDFDFGFVHSGGICSTHVTLCYGRSRCDWGGRFSFASGGSLRPPSRDHLALPTLLGHRPPHKSISDVLFFVAVSELQRAGSSRSTVERGGRETSVIIHLSSSDSSAVLPPGRWPASGRL